MVTSIFHGELGNNLFQLAACISLAERNGFEMEFCVQRECYVSIADRPLEIPSMFENSLKFGQFTDYSKYRIYNAPDLAGRYEYTPIPNDDNVAIKGYFQSEMYFKDVEDKLRNYYFLPNRNVIKKLSEKFDLEKIGKSTSIHMRMGGDRPSLQHYHKDLEVDYFRKGISEIQKLESVESITIFSDNIQWCKKNFDFENVFFVEGNSAVEDLFLMSMCKNNIVGNSTFSWWSAWLNRNPDKKVVAPLTGWVGPGLSHLNKNDLFPSSWIKL